MRGRKAAAAAELAVAGSAGPNSGNVLGETDIGQRETTDEQLAAQATGRKRAATGAKKSRKEIQREHRERVKAREAEVVLQVEAKRREIDDTKQECAAILQYQRALICTDAYSREMLEFLQQKVSEATLRDATNPPLSSSNDFRTVMLLAFDLGQLPSNNWWKATYIRLPRTLILEMEEDFMSYLQGLVTLWNASNEKTDVELRLSQVLFARRTAARLLAECRPDISRDLWRAAFVFDSQRSLRGNASTTSTGNEQSGNTSNANNNNNNNNNNGSNNNQSYNKVFSVISASIDTETDILSCLLSSLDISSDQKKLMLPPWYRYQERMESLEQQVIAAKQILSESVMDWSVVSDGSASQHIWAGKHLSIADATAFLEKVPWHALTIYGLLAVDICGELTPIQHARLILGCRPHLPDYARMCQLLLSTQPVLAHGLPAAGN